MGRQAVMTLLGCLIVACAAETRPSSRLMASNNQMQTNAILAAASCPAETKRYDPSPLDIKAQPVQLGAPEDMATVLPRNVSFLGGWYLTAESAEFGGLSGLTVTASGDLLAVSDRGAFIGIGLTDHRPNGRGTFMPMRDEAGRNLGGKADGDAEGLALGGGLAWVSFERNHRILAFDLDRCGSAATGVRFAKLPSRILGQKIDSNMGAEGLDYDRNGHIQAGYETAHANEAAIFQFDAKGMTHGPAKSVPVPEGYKLVGLSNTASLLRAYDPDTGNRNEIQLSDGLKIKLAPPLTVDNFEGVADGLTNDKTRLIYIISDDNFSERQRTLLYLFEIMTEA